MCINNGLQTDLRNFLSAVKTELELATERSLTDSRAATDRALKTARDQAATDVETFSAKIADLATNTAAKTTKAEEECKHQRELSLKHAASERGYLEARVNTRISKAKQQFQDQRELCQKHHYDQLETHDARIDADIHHLSERVHRAESLPPISDAQDILEQAADVKNTCEQSREAFQERYNRLEARVGADIHALSQRVHTAESLPPISDAHDFLEQAAHVKNTCDDNRKASDQEFTRLWTRLQNNIGSLTKRVRTLESTPAPWNLAALEGKQTALELRTQALERTANAHPDTDHEVFANDFARVDERLDALECDLPDRHQAAILEAKEQLREDLVTHQDRLKHQAHASHLEHNVRIQSLERRAVLPAVDPADTAEAAITQLILKWLHDQNLNYLADHPTCLPGFTVFKNPEPKPPT